MANKSGLDWNKRKEIEATLYVIILTAMGALLIWTFTAHVLSKSRYLEPIKNPLDFGRKTAVTGFVLGMLFTGVSVKIRDWLWERWEDGGS